MLMLLDFVSLAKSSHTHTVYIQYISIFNISSINMVYRIVLAISVWDCVCAVLYRVSWSSRGPKLLPHWSTSEHTDRPEMHSLARCAHVLHRMTRRHCVCVCVKPVEAWALIPRSWTSQTRSQSSGAEKHSEDQSSVYSEAFTGSALYCSKKYIYIHAFVRCFYPKWLRVYID